MNKSHNTYRLTEGAILLAAYVVLLLISLYVPVLGSLVIFVVPVPFMMYAAKHGGKSAALFTLAAILLSIVFGSILAVPMALAFGVTGAVMGYMIGMDRSRLAIFISGSLVFLVNLVAMYVVMVAFFQMDFVEETIKAFEESIALSQNMMEGLGQEMNSQMVEQFEASIGIFETLLPSMFVIASLSIVFLLQLVCVPILRRFKITVQNWPAFRELSFPKSVLWYYLFFLIASMLVSSDSGSYWVWAVTNVVFVLQLLMILQGFAFIAYFYDQKSLPKALFAVTLIAALFLPIILYIVRILGIIDLGFDLRKPAEKKK